MKKYFMVLALAGCLMVSLSSSVFAAGNSVYFDGLLGGKSTYKDHGYKDSNSLSCYIIGGEFPLDNKIKVVGEIAFGEEDDTSKFDAFLLKGDYRVYGKRKLRLDVAVGYYKRSYDNPDFTVNGMLIGCDTTYTIDKRSSFKGDFGFLVGGEYANRDATSMTVNLKYTYLVARNFGITGGYRYLSSSPDDADGNIKFIHSGLTVGAVCKF